MSERSIYTIGLLLFGLAALAATVWTWRLGEENLSKWEKLPRSVLPGIIFVVIDLLWCVPHARPLVPTSMKIMLYPLVIFCSWIAWQFLDYLFSRSLGGFFILLAYYFLHESFTWHSSAKPLFSILCYSMGVVGLFFCGKPYLFRDLIRKLSRETLWRRITSAYLFIFAACSMAIGIAHLVK